MSALGSSGTVVVVEDDVLISMMLEEICAEAGYKVLGSATDAREAERMILAERPTHLILDHRLAGPQTGLDLLERIEPKMPDLRVIVITGSNEPQTMAALRDHAPSELLVKPIDWDDLSDVLKRTSTNLEAS